MKNFKEWLECPKENLTEEERQALVEAGLSRIHTHLKGGKGIGIISPKTDNMDTKELHHARQGMVKDFRDLGYGPIHTQGRSDWGPEESMVVPGVSKKHLKSVGEKYKQQAVIHAKNLEKATMHHLSTSKTPHTDENIGAAHFNKPNNYGITIMKGAGFKPRPDKFVGPDKPPKRSFTFKESEDPHYVIEMIMYPPRGQLNPFWTHVK